MGLAAQNGQLTEGMQEASFSQNLALVVMILLAVYYIVANILCFFAYREFKGMLFDAGMGGNFGMSGMGGQRGGGDQAASGDNGQGQAAASSAPAASSSGASGGFKSFQGKGVTIGGT